jgi:hypothetical protein
VHDYDIKNINTHMKDVYEKAGNKFEKSFKDFTEKSA